MATKHIAIAAALLGVATPGHGFDTRSEAATVMFYYAIPLDAKAKKENIPWLGMQINGKRDYQSYSMDAPLFRLDETGGSTAANFLIVGGIALGAAALVAGRGKSAQQQVQQQQQLPAPAPAPQVPCPETCK